MLKTIIKYFYLNIISLMGIGDWGLGIGDWGLGPIPNPQSPQSPFKIILELKNKKYFDFIKIFLYSDNNI